MTGWMRARNPPRGGAMEKQKTYSRYFSMLSRHLSITTAPPAATAGVGAGTRLTAAIIVHACPSLQRIGLQCHLRLGQHTALPGRDTGAAGQHHTSTIEQYQQSIFTHNRGPRITRSKTIFDVHQPFSRSRVRLRTLKPSMCWKSHGGIDGISNQIVSSSNASINSRMASVSPGRNPRWIWRTNPRLSMI